MITVQVQSVIFQNEKSALLRALDSLANALRVAQLGSIVASNTQVVWGDTSPTPVLSGEEIEALAQKYGAYFQLRYVYAERQRGIAGVQNLLAQECTAEYILFLAPEAVVAPNLFEMISKPFLADTEHVGIAEARQTPAEHPKAYDRTTLETDWATMVCTMVPASVFTKLRFDDGMFPNCGFDVDFSWLVRLMGKKILFCPNAMVFLAKRPQKNGRLIDETAEYDKREAALFLAYKWSGERRYQTLCEQYRQDELGERVLARFAALEKEKLLPDRLDAKHTVAKFVGDGYTEERYVL